jgi:hypothetical protein
MEFPYKMNRSDKAWQIQGADRTKIDSRMGFDGSN